MSEMPHIPLPVPSHALGRGEIDAIITDLAPTIRRELTAGIHLAARDDEDALSPDTTELMLVEGESFVRAAYIIALDHDNLLRAGERDELVREAHFTLPEGYAPMDSLFFD